MEHDSPCTWTRSGAPDPKALAAMARSLLAITEELHTRVTTLSGRSPPHRAASGIPRANR